MVGGEREKKKKRKKIVALIGFVVVVVVVVVSSVETDAVMFYFCPVSAISGGRKEGGRPASIGDLKCESVTG